MIKFELISLGLKFKQILSWFLDIFRYVRVLYYSQACVNAHRKPPLYSNGGGPISVKDNHENRVHASPYVILQLIILSEMKCWKIKTKTLPLKRNIESK